MKRSFLLTLLTLLVIPTVYEILDQWKEWLMLKVFKRTPHAGRVEGLSPQAGD